MSREWCELCEEYESSVKCVECQQILCSYCKLTHSRAKISRRHRYKNLTRERRPNREEWTDLLGDWQNFRRKTVKKLAKSEIDLQEKLTNLNQSNMNVSSKLGEIRAKWHSVMDTVFNDISTNWSSTVSKEKQEIPPVPQIALQPLSPARAN